MHTKCYSFASALVFLALLSCGESENPKDLEAPVISSLSVNESIQPSAGLLISPNVGLVDVQFKVSDPSGVKEILLDVHGGFDGHSHARLSSAFERLNVKQIFSSSAADSKLVIPAGAQEVVIDAHQLAWTGTSSAVVDNLLAGPYHITISATDQEGNQTAFADGSNYHTTFYIQRPYAPTFSLVKKPNGKLDATAGQKLILAGKVKVTDNPLSTPLKFVWLRLTNEANLDEQKNLVESTIAQAMIGSSSWRNLTGEALIENQTFDLGAFLNQNSIIVPTGQTKLSLIIWAEDTAGNVTREAIPLEIN